MKNKILNLIEEHKEKDKETDNLKRKIKELISEIEEIEKEKAELRKEIKKLVKEFNKNNNGKEVIKVKFSGGFDRFNMFTFSRFIDFENKKL